MTRIWSISVLAIVLLAAACGGDDEPAATEGTDPTTATAAGEETTAAPTTAAAETTTTAAAATTTAAAASGVQGATISIGDETWEFEQVNFCAIPAADPPETSLIAVVSDGDLQLLVEIVDSTGAQRLEGDGVIHRIDFLNTADTTQLLWHAETGIGGEQFIKTDGSVITAEAGFNDLRTTEVEAVPGTLEMGCP